MRHFRFLLVAAVISCRSSDGATDPKVDDTCAGGKPCVLSPTPVVGGRTYTSITVGNEHSCGLGEGGQAFCWGSNRNGQLGSGSTVPFESEPVAVAGNLTFTRISSGALHSCALTSAGDAYCWGNGTSGALGTGLVDEVCGTVECSRVPAKVIGGKSFVSIAAGFRHTCALTSEGSAYCWGENSRGELGTGSYFSGSSLPELVSGSNTFLAIAAGSGFTCALANSGEIYCWGDASSGATGGTPPSACPGGGSGALCSASPLAVATEQRFIQLTAGAGHMCALSAEGHPYCWGDNEGGRMGIPGIGRTTVPTQVQLAGGALLSAIQLSAAGAHSCAVSISRDAYCWGQNSHAELGFGMAGEFSPVPARVPAEIIFGAIAAGGTALGGHSCALSGSGAAFCWGSREFGQVGDGR